VRRSADKVQGARRTHTDHVWLTFPFWAVNSPPPVGNNADQPAPADPRHLRGAGIRLAVTVGSYEIKNQFGVRDYAQSSQRASSRLEWRSSKRRNRQAHMRVAVLGAGLTGAGTALELARHAIPVTLIDQDPWPMNRASLRNEGKIHLGLIYANTGTLDTATLQLKGALRFRRLLARWLGSDANRLRRSTPFWYVVANDSLLTPDQLSEHYDALERVYSQSIREDESLDYLGERPRKLWEPCSRTQMNERFRSDRLLASFATAEVAIDTNELARLVRAAIAASPYIQLMPGHRVRGVSRTNGLLRVEGSTPDGSWAIEADHVVNALWENRMAIDATVGVTAEPGWVHRLKYRVIAALPDRLRNAPSVTMVLGAYGDVVIRPDATAYLSWYPSGLRGWTHELAPPDAWAEACCAEATTTERNDIADQFITHIDAWYPGIRDCVPLTVDAGVIVAYGRTDVCDPRSSLHERSRIGVTSYDGYHSAEPGKLTTAPLVAFQAAAAVIGQAAAL